MSLKRTNMRRWLVRLNDQGPVVVRVRNTGGSASVQSDLHLAEGVSLRDAAALNDLVAYGFAVSSMDTTYEGHVVTQRESIEISALGRIEAQAIKAEKRDLQ